MQFLVPEKTVYDETTLHEVGNTPEYPPKISAQSLYLKNLGKIYENLHRNHVSKNCNCILTYLTLILKSFLYHFVSITASIRSYLFCQEFDMKEFCSFFGKNENKIICFRNFLCVIICSFFIIICSFANFKLDKLFQPSVILASNNLLSQVKPRI
jgi:hypothetical protein